MRRPALRAGADAFANKYIKYFDVFQLLWCSPFNLFSTSSCLIVCVHDQRHVAPDQDGYAATAQRSCLRNRAAQQRRQPHLQQRPPAASCATPPAVPASTSPSRPTGSPSTSRTVRALPSQVRATDVLDRRHSQMFCARPAPPRCPLSRDTFPPPARRLCRSSPLRPTGPISPIASRSSSAGWPWSFNQKTRPISNKRTSATCRARLRPIESTNLRNERRCAVIACSRFTGFGRTTLRDIFARVKQI